MKTTARVRRRSPALFASALVIAALSTACDDGAAPPADGSIDQTAPRDAGPPHDWAYVPIADGGQWDAAMCVGQLDEYCNGRPCPDWATRAAALRADAAALRTDAGVCLSPMLLGTCGTGTWLEDDRGIGEFRREFFDANGRMIFAHHETDTGGFCDGHSVAEDYGAVPPCKPVVTEKLCGR